MTTLEHNLLIGDSGPESATLHARAVSARRRPHAVIVSALTLAVVLCGHALVPSSKALRVAGVPPVTVVAAETSIGDMLRSYSAAMESLDVDAVKKIQPSIPAANLARAFKAMRELKVAIDEVSVLSIDGTTARVSCRVTQTLTPKVGPRQTTTVTRVMRLRRGFDSWAIDGFER